MVLFYYIFKINFKVMHNINKSYIIFSNIINTVHESPVWPSSKDFVAI